MTQQFVHALALGLDPAWRRLPDVERRADADRFVEVVQHPNVRTHTYSMIGLEPGADLLVWI